MLIDVLPLKSNIEKEIILNEKIEFSKNDLNDNKIIDIKDAIIEGILIKNCLDEYTIDAKIKGIMVLPCTVCSEPVEHRFNVKIEGNIENLLVEIDENYKKSEKTIDIFPIIWENILLEIPLRVVDKKCKDKTIEGNGWQLGKEKINPALEKLKDLL